jgi:hypothetical protein
MHTCCGNTRGDYSTAVGNACSANSKSTAVPCPLPTANEPPALREAKRAMPQSRTQPLSVKIPTPTDFALFCIAHLEPTRVILHYDYGYRCTTTTYRHLAEAQSTSHRCTLPAKTQTSQPRHRVLKLQCHTSSNLSPLSMSILRFTCYLMHSRVNPCPSPLSMAMTMTSP